MAEDETGDRGCDDVAAPSQPRAGRRRDRRATLPELRRRAAHSDAVTALRICGVDIEYRLPVGKLTYSVGSDPACDVAIDSRLLSRLHCILERRGGGLRVHDQSSRNGTSQAGHSIGPFEIGAGDLFVAAATTLYALNHHMQVARPPLAEVLGTAPIQALDETLMAAARDTPVVVVGETADQPQLAAAIHRASRRRSEALVICGDSPDAAALQPQLVALARGGTMILLLDEGRAIDPEFLALVSDPRRNVRLVAFTATRAAAIRALGIDLVARSFHVSTVPLRERPGDVLWLLDRCFSELRTSFRASDLSSVNRVALCAYRWPGGVGELREFVARLVQLATHESIYRAAPLLDLSHVTLRRWLDTLGLTLPIFANT